MSHLLKLGKERLIKGVGRMSELVIDKGKGCYVHDMISGKNYLDFTSGIAVTSTGHCHPKVVAAIQEQASNLIHSQANIHLHPKIVELSDKLTTVMPNNELNSFFITNSGAEAVENSIKLARNITKKKNVIVFQGSYHGRTFGTMGLTTSKTIYSKSFAPFMPGIYTCPYPYSRQIGIDMDEDQLNEYCINQLKLLLKQQSAPEDTAAILIEPILGEGGYVPANKRFLLELKNICKQNDIMFIADEVQSGFARSGHWFASEWADPQLPDILVMAKGIASGFPISAVATKKHWSDLQVPGSMGGTYAGNPIGCAAAIATIDVLKEENILNNVNQKSEYIFNRLNKELLEIVNKFGYCIDVRGKGLMIGIEFVHKDKKETKLASEISQYCLNHLDMLLMTTSVYDTLRLMPALIISDREVEIAVDNILIAAEKCLNK
ncbi:aminotransferase class-III [Neoconidiobolus thromboides FSU 785]|nr:aminotransferase class-III [Neoconidiobolus thromboides FSU 785]